MQEAARSRYNDVIDFHSSSAILKIEWREEDLGFTAHVQPFLSPVHQSRFTVLAAKREFVDQSEQQPETYNIY